jgi:uncharacterized membrane protein (UPF0127 family)
MLKANGASETALELNKLTRIGLTVFVIGAIIGGLVLYDSHTSKRCDIKLNHQCFVLKYALSDTQKNKGLSGRESLPQDTGMIFIFDQAGKQYFWMKDMKFALDIIWLDSSKRIVGIEKDVQPDTYPDKFTAQKPAQYVLEFNSGTANKAGLELGQQLNF